MKASTSAKPAILFPFGRTWPRLAASFGKLARVRDSTLFVHRKLARAFLPPSSSWLPRILTPIFVLSSSPPAVPCPLPPATHQQDPTDRANLVRLQVQQCQHASVVVSPLRHNR